MRSGKHEVMIFLAGVRRNFDRFVGWSHAMMMTACARGGGRRERCLRKRSEKGLFLWCFGGSFVKTSERVRCQNRLGKYAERRNLHDSISYSGSEANMATLVANGLLLRPNRRFI